MNLLENMKASAFTQKHIDFINLYEKVSFMEVFFDKDSIINIENRSNNNQPFLKSVTGLKNGAYTSLMETDLTKYITVQYPLSFDFNIMSMQMGLNNNLDGWDSFIARVFTDVVTTADYKQNLMLNKLPHKEYKKIKQKKI